jgi:hypothetical protein
MTRPNLAVPIALLLALPLGASGCVVTVPVPETVYSDCHAIGSSDWAARIERIPDHHNRPVLKATLIVTGKVVVPGAGYGVSLDFGPLQRLDQPVRQILVRTDPPERAEAGGPVTVAVEGRFPARRHENALTIRCGDGTLAIVRSIAPPPPPVQAKAKTKAGRSTRTRPTMLVAQARVRTTGIPAA